MWLCAGLGAPIAKRGASGNAALIYSPSILILAFQSTQILQEFVASTFGVHVSWGCAIRKTKN